MQQKRLTATGTIHSASCVLHGFYVASTTAGTLVFRDGGASGDQKSGTITPAVGFHPWPGNFAETAHVTFGGTADVTFFYEG